MTPTTSDRNRLISLLLTIDGAAGGNRRLSASWAFEMADELLAAGVAPAPAPSAVERLARDWLGKFAAYRTDCLSQRIWRESDEFIWDSTGPLRAALDGDPT
jgi:hypothetical protein